MSAIGKILFSPFKALAGAIVGKKPQPQPQQMVVPMQRPQAQTRYTSLLEAVAGRRGSRVNQRTAPRGVEPATAGKKTLLGT